MNSQLDKERGWRPTFSVRTMVIVVTLVCLYAACWEPTKRWGVEDVAAHLTRENNGRPVAPELKAPLLLEFAVHSLHAQPGKTRELVTETRYYLWFFGYVAKLPYEHERVRPLIR